MHSSQRLVTLVFRIFCIDVSQSSLARNFGCWHQGCGSCQTRQTPQFQLSSSVLQTGWGPFGPAAMTSGMRVIRTTRSGVSPCCIRWCWAVAAGWSKMMELTTLMVHGVTNVETTQVWKQMSTVWTAKPTFATLALADGTTLVAVTSCIPWSRLWKMREKAWESWRPYWMNSSLALLRTCSLAASMTMWTRITYGDLIFVQPSDGFKIGWRGLIRFSSITSRMSWWPAAAMRTIFGSSSWTDGFAPCDNGFGQSAVVAPNVAQCLADSLPGSHLHRATFCTCLCGATGAAPHPGSATSKNSTAAAVGELCAAGRVFWVGREIEGVSVFARTIT